MNLFIDRKIINSLVSSCRGLICGWLTHPALSVFVAVLLSGRTDLKNVSLGYFKVMDIFFKIIE